MGPLKSDQPLGQAHQFSLAVVIDVFYWAWTDVSPRDILNQISRIPNLFLCIDSGNDEVCQFLNRQLLNFSFCELSYVVFCPIEPLHRHWLHFLLLGQLHIRFHEFYEFLRVIVFQKSCINFNILRSNLLFQLEYGWWCVGQQDFILLKEILLHVLDEFKRKSFGELLKICLNFQIHPIHFYFSNLFFSWLV